MRQQSIVKCQAVEQLPAPVTKEAYDKLVGDGGLLKTLAGKEIYEGGALCLLPRTALPCHALPRPAMPCHALAHALLRQ